MNDTAMTCPGDGELRAFASDPLKEEWADLAAHISVCDRCRDAFAALVSEDAEDVEPTPEDDAFIKAFTGSHCRSRGEEAKRLAESAMKRRMSFVRASGPYALAASPAAGVAAPAAEAGARCAPDEEVRLVYAAESADAVSGFWRAELTVPPAARPETMIGVSVSDAARRPVAEGLLRISGCTLPIVAGAASMPFSLFLDGIADTDVSFSFPGTSPVSGRLLFF